MRILVLCNCDPNDLANGMGLIVNHTLASLDRDFGIAADVISLRYEGHRRDEVGQLFRRVSCAAEYVRRWPGKIEALRCLANAGLSRTESEFLDHVQRISGDYAAVIWFGFGWDVVSRRLPSVCRVPILMHGNDSISLMESSLGPIGHLRRRLAERQERAILNSGYRASVYVSVAEQRRLAQIGLGARTVALPNGVDTGVFRPGIRETAAPPLNLLFVGVMNFRPNVDAVQSFVAEVAPRLEAPVRLRIVGRDVAPEVRRLSLSPPHRLTIAGGVRDVVAEYQVADALVAPFWQCRGIKNKVLESLACGLPVIAAQSVLDAFGEPPAGVFPAASPAEFASVLDGLAAVPARLEEKASMARHCAVERFSWKERTARLLQLLQVDPQPVSRERSAV